MALHDGQRRGDALVWLGAAISPEDGRTVERRESAPTDILSIERFYITISGKNIELMSRDLNTVIEFRPTTRGRPRAFCYYGDRFELDRLPDTNYSMPLYYVQQLAPLATVNGWS